MTTEDRQIWNEAKAEVVAELQANRERYREQYDAALATDPRIWEYVAENIDNPDGHNYYELLAIRRFFELLDRWQWRPKRVKRRIRFYEKLRFSGVTGRRRYKLTPVQVWHLANIFGFARPDGLVQIHGGIADIGDQGTAELLQPVHHGVQGDGLMAVALFHKEVFPLQQVGEATAQGVPVL